MGSNFFVDCESRRIVASLSNVKSKNLPHEPACYALEDAETGRFYVGSTQDAKTRIRSHIKDLLNNSHYNKDLQAAYNQSANKENFVIHVLVEYTAERAKNREQLILDEGMGTGVLFNKRSVAEHGNSEAVSLAKSTPEATALTSKQATERWKDPSMRKKMIESLGENVVVDGVSYGSVREASRETGHSIATIRSRLSGGRASLKDIRPATKSVICEGVVYPTVNDAAEAYGIGANTMTYRLQSTSQKWVQFNYI